MPLFSSRDDVFTERRGHDLSSLYPQHLVLRKQHEQEEWSLPWGWYTKLTAGRELNKWSWVSFQGNDYHDGPHNPILARRRVRDSDKVVVSMGSWFPWRWRTAQVNEELFLSTSSSTIFVPNFFFFFLECKGCGCSWVGFESTRHQESIPGTTGLLPQGSWDPTDFCIICGLRNCCFRRSREHERAAQTLLQDWLRGFSSRWDR